MREPYLEVTFRHGSILAAYYYLPRHSNSRSIRCERDESGLVIDFDEQDRPIGIELTAPRKVTLETFNGLLERLGQAPIEARDLAPLEAA